MKIKLLKTLAYEKEGSTLIEIILALAILGIIIVSFLNMFVFSTATNRKSEDILDATYVAQNLMEQRYAESKNGGEIPRNQEHSYPTNGYWINEIIDVDGNLVRIIVKVYADDSKNQLKAQMETYLLWDYD